MESGVRFEIVEAFDINDKANDVYELNFGHRPCQVVPFFFVPASLSYVSRIIS